MHLHVNGTRLWFDVDGLERPIHEGAMERRPTVVLLHGGPGSFDHTYLKPDFGRLAAVARVIYLDLRDHGRSAWGSPEDWSYEICADDVRAFCDALGIERPIVYGHSLGGFIAQLYAVRHPGHPAAIVLGSTSCRFDVPRIVDHFRTIAGDGVADLVRRVYMGEGPVTPEAWAPCWKLFGPGLPDRSHAIVNAELNRLYLPKMGRFDVGGELRKVTCPTLVLSGTLDPVFTPEVARELIAALPADLARLELIEGAGHFPWLDAPDRHWPPLLDFVRRTGATAAGPVESERAT